MIRPHGKSGIIQALLAEAREVDEKPEEVGAYVMAEDASDVRAVVSSLKSKKRRVTHFWAAPSPPQNHKQCAFVDTCRLYRGTFRLSYAWLLLNVNMYF